MWKPPKFSLGEEQFGEEGGPEKSDTKQESSDEDDYMSDAFLNNCAEQTTSSDIRPGLPMSITAKRSLQLAKKKAETKKVQDALKAKKITPKERLEEGLNTPLGANNKGFSMLQKMGYKPGTSLGKEGSNGRLQPVSVTVKQGRAGLGLAAMLSERKRESEQRHMARMRRLRKECDPEKFREQKRLQAAARQMLADLKQCRRAAYRLDTEQDYTEPVEPYLWPPHLLPEADECGDTDTNSSGTDKATIDTTGTDGDTDTPGNNIGDTRTGDTNTPTADTGDTDTSNADRSDHDGSEPGHSWQALADREREQHYDDYDERYQDANEGEADLLKEEDMEPWQLELYLGLTATYLREGYHYCVWCGTAYTDHADLVDNCPGDTRADH